MQEGGDSTISCIAMIYIRIQLHYLDLICYDLCCLRLFSQDKELPFGICFATAGWGVPWLQLSFLL